MGADDESATVLEQSRTRDEGERETREGEECLSGPGDGHSTGKYHHRRTQRPNCPGDARQLSSNGGRPQLWSQADEATEPPQQQQGTSLRYESRNCDGGDPT